MGTAIVGDRNEREPASFLKFIKWKFTKKKKKVIRDRLSHHDFFFSKSQCGRATARMLDNLYHA